LQIITEKLILCNGSDCKTALFQKDAAPVTSPVSCNMTIETDFPTPPTDAGHKASKRKRCHLILSSGERG